MGHSICRILTLLCVVFFAYNLKDYTNVYFLIAIYIGLSHFLLSFYYSRKQLADFITSKKRLYIVFGIAALGLLSAFCGWPTALKFFAIHWALAETYLWQKDQDKPVYKTLMGVRFFMHLFFYLALIKFTPMAQPFSSIGFLLCYGISLSILIRDRKQWGRKTFWDLLVFDFLNLAVWAYCYISNTSLLFIDFIIFHVVIFWLLPFIKPANRKMGFALKFIGLQLVAALLFWLGDRILYPGGGSIPRWSFIDPTAWMSIYTPQTALNFWGTFHVILSPIMSTANPEFINYLAGRVKRTPS